MRIVVDINHPAHVHYFKNFIWKMQNNGHSIFITATEKDITCRLLEKYGFEYALLGSYGTSLVQKALNIPIIDHRMVKAGKECHPDLFLGFGSIRAAHAAFLLRKPCINFEDTGHSREQIALYLPFVRHVCTPSCYQEDLGKKQIRFDGYMELAHLHPAYFTPNPAVLAEIGLTPEDPYMVMRFVSWEASHDLGQQGIRDPSALVKALERHCRILITSEGPLPLDLEQYRLQISPEKLHDLLYYATMYIGEGATTASECAVLGTHAIYVNTLRLCYTDEEGEIYGLVSTISDPREMEQGVLTKAMELLNTPDLRRIGKQKRQTLLEDKIDVTAFMVWFIEHYPESVHEAIRNPGFQEQFRTKWEKEI